MLPWDETEPGGEVPTALESMKVRCKGEDRAGGHRANPGNGAEPALLGVRCRRLAKLEVQLIDLFGEQPNLVQIRPVNLPNSVRQINGLSLLTDIRLGTEMAATLKCG